MKQKDNFTDVVETVQDTTTQGGDANSSGDQQVITSEGNTVTLGMQKAS